MSHHTRVNAIEPFLKVLFYTRLLPQTYYEILKQTGKHRKVTNVVQISYNVCFS